MRSKQYFTSIKNNPHEISTDPCKVVVNHHIELTEEEKAEQRAIAFKRYQEEEMRKLQQRNSRPKAAKPQPKPIQELSLFQGMEL